MNTDYLKPAAQVLNETIKVIESDNADILQQIAALHQTLAENKKQLVAVYKTVNCLSLSERQTVQAHSKRLLLNLMKREQFKWWTLSELIELVCKATQIEQLDKAQVQSLRNTLRNLVNSGVVESRYYPDKQWRIKPLHS